MKRKKGGQGERGGVGGQRDSGQKKKERKKDATVRKISITYRELNEWFYVEAENKRLKKEVV